MAENGGPLTFSAKDRALIMAGLGEFPIQEREKFVRTCEIRRLNPLLGQVHAIKRGGKLSAETSIDGYRARAVLAGDGAEYEGQTGPHWCGEDGEWHDAWVGEGDPVACRVGVWRRGFREACYGVARWASYAQRSPTWRQMGDVMLAKCAEALALRKAFPEELGGMHTRDEMDSAAADDLRAEAESASNGPDAEEDPERLWIQKIEESATGADLEAVGDELKEAGAGTPGLRAAYKARMAEIQAAEASGGEPGGDWFDE